MAKLTTSAKLLLLNVLAIICSINCAELAMGETPAMRDQARRLSAAVCVPNLASLTEKAKIVNDCETTHVPKPVHDVYHSCIREAMGINEIKLPIFCYKLMPNGDKLNACMESRSQAAAEQGIVVDPNVIREFKEKYMSCMERAA